MGDDWTLFEVEAVVADYLSMLEGELRGGIYNKADHNRNLQKLLPARSRGSIEFKHQNISAALLEFGFPYIDGYKPRSNFQGLLAEVVERQVAHRTDLRNLVSQLVIRPEPAPPAISDILSLLTEPPQREKKLPRVNQPTFKPVNRTLQNYLEIEARNSSLGRAGECLILKFEHQRLWDAGQKSLADRIEHTSAIVGDGTGYDIHSFEVDGRDRLIEVKTTRFGAFTPFFASSAEVGFSDLRSADFHLCRLYHFDKDPRLFFLSGSMHRSCDLEPAMFRGLPRNILGSG